MNHSRPDRLIDRFAFTPFYNNHARPLCRLWKKGRKKKVHFVHSKTWVWFYPVNYSRVCDLREVALWVLTVCTVIQTITAWGYWKGAPSDLGMCTQHCWQLIMNASTDSLIMRGSEAKLLTSWCRMYVPWKILVLAEYSPLSKSNWLPTMVSKRLSDFFLQGLLLVNLNISLRMAHNEHATSHAWSLALQHKGRDIYGCFPWNFIPCAPIVQNSVHGDQAELDPIHDDSVAVFFFSGKERESKHIYIARWGLVVGWISHQCLGLA
jgi:hypothetical protein